MYAGQRPSRVITGGGKVREAGREGERDDRERVKEEERREELSLNSLPPTLES